MKHLKFFEQWNYSENESINSLIQNARKWKEVDFIEEYVDRNDISIYPIRNIKEGDEVFLVRIERDDNGKRVYKDGIQQHIPYKTVIADKDYGDKHWRFIMDNTKELHEEARKLYHEYKDVPKPEFTKDSETVRVFHASPNRFDKFEYSDDSPSGQVGSDVGFFFFLNRKNAEYYASVLKENREQAYIYDVDVQIGNQLELRGEDIGTNWGRQSELSQAEIEGHDTVIIRDADTGYGITDELVVFDDDNIKIINIVIV